MSWIKYNVSDLAQLLNVTEEDFHRKIKKMIKRDFKKELERQNFENPDIHLDENFVMRLVDPRDNTNYFDTDLDIYAYTED